MPHGRERVFIGPRVNGGEIKVMDLFTVDDHTMEFDGISASSEKGVSRLEPGHEPKGVHEGTHGVVVFLRFFPLALPHDVDSVVVHGAQCVFSASGGFVDITHGLVVHLVTGFVTVQKTTGTTVPKATVGFVHDARVDIVPVHVKGFFRLDESRVQYHCKRDECDHPGCDSSRSTIPGLRGNTVYFVHTNH